ncbi:MAG: DeoR/GlpR transcriptional regulator [Kiritimatiellae bacterium]|nr:DeoR/GlpR transcriptional regulator [Kiritimatiellia bacterium]
MEKLRTHLILEYLKKCKTCTLTELMERFGVSSATIHRDVAELARRDAVERVRGGLIFRSPPPGRDGGAEYAERVVTNRAGKVAAAQKALACITEGDILFLDSSTTVYELAVMLVKSDIAHLTIVTNSVSIIQNFRKMPAHWVLIGLGGTYDPQLNSILGAAALAQLAEFNITKAFVSAFGVNEHDVTTNHERQAEIIRKVLAAADRRYLIADRSKIGRTGLYRLATRSAFNAIFTG